MKRILALLLGIMMILSGLNLQAAESTLEQRAERLNKLGVLKGDGKSYNLAGTLTRQEAATFIVRLLGAEKEILANKSKYAAVPFQDVKSETDWAAPYIGYCTQKGIINGYTDNTFRPTAKLELQAFAKLLLVAMGYEYDKDFKWETTLTKAQDIKVVTADEIALAKGNAFTRGDVIRLLDRVLTMKNVQSEKEMFYNLLKNDGVTESTLAEVGLVRKVGQEKIEEVKELSPGRFSIRFSVVPKTFSAENMILVEETGRNLKVKSLKVTDLLNIYVVDTDQPAENVKYSIVIKDVIDRNNQFFQEYRRDFVALRKGSLESDFFRISQVKVLDKHTLEVEFTHPVGEVMTNHSLYTIRDESKVIAKDQELKVTLSGNDKVRVKMLNASYVADQLYSLTVAGSAQSKLGVRINSGKDDMLRFLGKQVEEAKFDVISIELIDKNKLRLTTNKPVSRKTAEQVFSYLLTDSSKTQIAINKASVLENVESEEQSIVLETARNLVEDRNYVLLINQLYTEGRTEEIIEKEYRFTTGTVNTSTYNLSTAEQMDPYTIEFTFDTPMDQRTATVANNYFIRRENGGKTIVPSAIYYDYESSRMFLYLAEPLREVNGADYILYAKTDIKGANGEQRKENAKITFGVTDPEVKKVGFEKVIYIGDNSIQILFDEPVAKAIPNLDIENYRVYDKNTKEDLYLLGVRYIDGHRLVLSAQKYDPQKTYELKVKEVLEYNGVTRISDLPAIEIEKGNLVQ